MNTNKTQKSIGSHLQAMRKAAGFKSAKAFAEYVGVNPNTYTQYEQGLVAMSYERAWQFADALKCTLDELGGRTPPEARTYTDKGQEIVNICYESMNDKGKETLVSVAQSMQRDTANRLVKNQPEEVEDDACEGVA